jgi:hypothetical protein
MDVHVCISVVDGLCLGWGNGRSDKSIILFVRCTARGVDCQW